MKQHIDINDLNQLSDKGKERLRERWKFEDSDKIISTDKDSIWNKAPLEVPNLSMLCSDRSINIIKNTLKLLPLLSIGQMIEFLGDDFNQLEFISNDGGNNGWYLWAPHLDKPMNELCDTLWSACKEILERE